MSNSNTIKEKKNEEKFKVVAEIGTIVHPDGRRFQVTVLGHTLKGRAATSQESLYALTVRSATLLGQLGLDLLTEQGLLEKLPKGFWYNSFEAGNHHRVPRLHTYLSGGDGLSLGRFGYEWDNYGQLVCFVEVK